MMNFEGQSLRCFILKDRPDMSGHSGKNIAELQFNLNSDSVNKFNALTLKELGEAVALLKSHQKDIAGLLVTSGKDCFIVGADIMEFLEYFKKTEEELTTWGNGINRIFSDIEDFDFPTVSAINGYAFGGGFEMALSTCYRMMSSDTKVGLPETKLGIMPGWGGTIRLSRLAGADNAIEWIASGEQWNAEAAFKIGAVDGVVAPEKLRKASLDLLVQAIEGKFDWRARREEKKAPLKLNSIESMMSFETAKAFVFAKAGAHYPAPIAAIEAMQKGASKDREGALVFETSGFVKLAKTQVAHSLVSLFLGDQYVKKVSKKISKDARPVQMSAVLGAGIMGGGVAYQSAVKGTPILMKDIQPKALEIGMGQAIKLLDKQVERKKITTAQMGATVAKIQPTLSYSDFKNVDFVVEAVVENEKVKKTVLADVEKQMKEGAILASNTSTISISRLAESLQHPENFCGMHFFNPVHRMPLVEIIRGKKSSTAAVATAVSYALSMGKTPIVVNDCPGFFVNRVLFPYFAGFEKLLQDGVDYQRVDKVMEKFGWPMGPAYLLDVVGIDTGHHANSVMAAEFPDRMSSTHLTAIEVFYKAERYGQKNNKGFYKYSLDKKGMLAKEVDSSVTALLQSVVRPGAVYPNTTITDQEIIDRMMLPMIIECSRCLEEQIVGSAVEADIGLIYGLGFPPFRGGALRYADAQGIKEFCQMAKNYHHLGKLYEPTSSMLKMAETGHSFYQ